jgi:hypothetical protein
MKWPGYVGPMVHALLEELIAVPLAPFQDVNFLPKIVNEGLRTCAAGINSQHPAVKLLAKDTVADVWGEPRGSCALRASDYQNPNLANVGVGERMACFQTKRLVREADGGAVGEPVALPDVEP